MPRKVPLPPRLSEVTAIKSCAEHVKSYYSVTDVLTFCRLAGYDFNYFRQLVVTAK